MKSKRTKESGDAEEISDGGTVHDLLRSFLEEKKEEKQRQELRDQHFLQIFEALTTNKQDEDKRREERRIEEDRKREERLLEERKIFAERLQKEEEEKRVWFEQYEKERRDWYEQNMRVSNPNGNTPSLEIGDQEKPREARMQKLTDTDDIEHFLTMFERVANAYKWPDNVWVLKLAPLLTGKAQAAYANMDSDKAQNFDEVKQAILKRFNINEETYRQRFRSTKKKAEESYTETEVRLRDLSKKWLKPKERNKDELVDVIIREQLVNAMPRDLQLRVRERKPKTAEEAGTIADDIISARGSIFNGNTDNRNCLKCGIPGHFARDCRSTTNKVGNFSLGPRDDRKKSENIMRRDAGLTCYSCGKLGHIASRCPSRIASKDNGGKKIGTYFCDNTKSEAKQFTSSSYKSRDQEYVCQGLVEGIPTELLVDSGASCTLVHQDLVTNERINENDQLQIKCAHGDSVVYPTANIEIKINDQIYHVRAGVSPTLPRPVLLGRDIGNLLELAVREQEAYAVLTRIQKRKKEKEEATTLAKEMTSGVKTRRLTRDDEKDIEEDEQAPLHQFDDSVFEGGQKQRKTKRERRQAKKVWQNIYSQPTVLGSDDESTNTEELEDCPQTERDDSNRGDDELTTSSGISDQEQSTSTILNVGKREFQNLQENDPTLESIRKLVREETLPDNTGKFFKRAGLYYRQWCSKEADQDGSQTAEQLILPRKCRKLALELAHDIPMGGHLGRKKTLDRLLARFYWPGIIHDVNQHCKSCGTCQKSAGRRGVKKAHLVSLPIIEEPFQRIAMDIVGPLIRSKSGNKFILVICDYSTRYPEAIPLKNVEAETIAEELGKFFSRMGVPKEILTDQGSNFTSQLLKEVYRMLKITPIRTSPYHPQTDGLVERFNGTLKSMLKKLAKDDPTEWDRWLPYLLFAYREVPNESTGFSPFELLFGRHVRGPLDILRETWETDPKSSESIVSYVMKMRERLSETMEIAQTNLAKAQKRQKKWYDQSARVREFNEGEEVLVLLPTSTNKLRAEWQGPYKVKRKVGTVNYEVEMVGKRKRTKVYHVNMLRKWHTPQATSYFEDKEETDTEYSTDEGETIPVPPCFNEDESEVFISSNLQKTQREQMERLLEEYKDIIQDKPGRTDQAEHRIETGDAVPIRQAPYRIPYAQREKMKEEIEKMEEMGVIQPSRSEWASPVVMVPKKDGTQRFCVDYRKLNKISSFDAYPMARIDDIIDRLGTAKYVSTIDLTRGYWQVPLTEESRKKTAFITPNGLYEFTTMPFGLHGAPATFQRLMDCVLQGSEEFVAALLDDIIIFSQTWTEHLHHVREVLERLRKAGLTARPSKCHFGMEEVVYLGHVVGGGKVKPTESKVQAVKDFPRPKTKTDVRAFLGLSGYYRKFIPNYAEIAAPLSDLTRKAAPQVVSWTDQCSKAFVLLKDRLCSLPVLHSPDLSKPFVVQTDASERGIGAVLSQEGPDGEHPVAYISRKLRPRETRYATIEKECLAIVWAIQTLRVYLYGQDFTIQTDHHPLQWLDQMKDKNGRLTRWSLSLQSYKFKIQHRSGKENANADTMSRLTK